jgi:hypothetical protein
VWNSSDIWEHPQQIKIPFMKKLRADLRWGILTIGAESSVLPFAIQKYV